MIEISINHMSGSASKLGWWSTLNNGVSGNPVHGRGGRKESDQKALAVSRGEKGKRKGERREERGERRCDWPDGGGRKWI